MLTAWLGTIKNQLSGWHHRNFGVQAIDVSQADIASWFSSPLGQRILQEEINYVEPLLAELFGYHLMQLSVLDGESLLHTSPITHPFSVLPFAGQQEKLSYVRGEFEHLPVDSNAIDVTLLHHALDFSTNPHQLLREAARVTLPNGHIVLIGFNPWSMLGIGSSLGCLFSKSHAYRRHHLRLARLKDWFKVLELELVYSDKGYFGLPINRYHSSLWEKIAGNLCRPWGGFYILVLRKNITPMTMMKASWKNKKVIPKWSKGMATSSVLPPPPLKKVLQSKEYNEES